MQGCLYACEDIYFSFCNISPDFFRKLNDMPLQFFWNKNSIQAVLDEILEKEKIYILTAVQPALHHHHVSFYFFTKPEENFFFNVARFPDDKHETTTLLQFLVSNIWTHVDWALEQFFLAVSLPGSSFKRLFSLPMVICWKQCMQISYNKPINLKSGILGWIKQCPLWL